MTRHLEHPRSVRRRRHRTRGITLVEAMVASAVLAVGVVSLTSVAANSVRLHQAGEKKSAAIVRSRRRSPRSRARRSRGSQRSTRRPSTWTARSRPRAATRRAVSAPVPSAAWSAWMRPPATPRRCSRSPSR
ncbi:MAG: hypothetical protein FJ293_02150 [Planctomycetes bacterium]|nr:hypothetical protein [Planctomycetota bacterium]